MYNVAGGKGCLDGDRCPFAHSPYQLARPKSYLCPSKAGYCCGRKPCPFAHDEAELEKSPMPVIKRLCKYLGSSHGCNLGDGCRNAHSHEEVVSGIRLAGSNRVDLNNDYVLSLYHGCPQPKSTKKSSDAATSRAANSIGGLRIESYESNPSADRSQPLLWLPLSHSSLGPSTPQSHNSSDITTPYACHISDSMNRAILESVAASVVENHVRTVAVADILSCLSFLIDSGFDSKALNESLVDSLSKYDP